MTITDYADKMKMIEDFYIQTGDTLDMVENSIIGFQYNNAFDIRKEYTSKQEEKDIHLFGESKKDKIERQKRQLIINLGRSGEYAIKFLLLLKQMKDYPNQSYLDFSKKPIYNIPKGNNPLTYYKNQYGLSDAIVTDIENEKSNHALQPMHDFDYIFYILKRLYPNLSKKVYDSFELSIKSFYIEDSIVYDDAKKIMTCFPQCVWEPTTEVESDILQEYIDEYDRIRRESGDAFIRLRYIENNPNNKQYYLNEVMYYIKYLNFYVYLVHEMNKDDLNASIPLAYSKHKFKNLADEYVTKQINNAGDKLIFRGEYEKVYESEFKKVDEVFEIIGKYYDQIIPTLNTRQLHIYNQIHGKNVNWMNMYENITNNVRLFNEIPQLFGKVPLLLDAQNNINVLGILMDNGLDLNDDNVKYIDSTIFCIPAETVHRICLLMKENEEKLIVDNMVNMKFFKYFEKERKRIEQEKNPDGPPPLPLRHI